MIRKLRFIEPANRSPFKPSILNAFTYNKYLKNPSTGLITLATIAHDLVDDVLMYSESISAIDFDDVLDADAVLLSLNTFNALRGYEVARLIRKQSKAFIVMGGLHASLYWQEAIQHCDCVLLGDADESLVDLIRALDSGRPIDFPGAVVWKDGQPHHTGERAQPERIDTIPDRDLVYDYHHLASRYDTLWPQVHASRGCPHDCAYCSVVAHFGRKLRTRSPESVVQDIRQAIAFHERRGIPRLNTTVWLTDDNFPQDRAWALSVLRAIIDSGIRYHFSVQARWEAGFDDEMLDLMRRAGFIELALGIEFLDDESFVDYGKKSTRGDIVRAIANIRAHGIGVRGLFIVGTDHDRRGVGKRIARFFSENGIHGALVQSMFFTPGTAFFEENRHRLIDQNWDRYSGSVVHYPSTMRPHELQEEIIDASRRIYSLGRLLWALLTYPFVRKVLFLGECLWQASLRRDLAREIPYLKSLHERTALRLASYALGNASFTNHADSSVCRLSRYAPFISNSFLCLRLRTMKHGQGAHPYRRPIRFLERWYRHKLVSRPYSESFQKFPACLFA